MSDHLTERRLLDISKDTDARFLEEELQHLADCEECGRLLTAFRQSLSDEGTKQTLNE